MEPHSLHSLLEGCLEYARSTALPMPLPEDPAQYANWRREVASKVSISGDAEEAWFELDRLIRHEPLVAWQVLIELTLRSDEFTWGPIAAGPLRDFLQANAEQFASEIETELMNNTGFRNAYYWLAG